LNKPSDSDAEHWDMALLLSGLDFYAIESGKNNYVTMGIQPNNINKITLEKILIVVFPLQVCPLSLVFALTFTIASSESLASRTSKVNRIHPPDSLQFT
jgi:hypothetical protein